MKTHAITIEPDGFSFRRLHKKRFECLALIAYMRKIEPLRWVTIEDICQLPQWRGNTKRHVGQLVGRYIEALEGTSVIEAQTSRWSGPYRLRVAPSDINFDMADDAVREFLNLPYVSRIPGRDELLAFTEQYTEAASLLFKGHLSSASLLVKGHLSSPSQRKQLTAIGEFTLLAERSSVHPALRLLATLAAVRVLDRLGRFKAAHTSLQDCDPLRDQVHDPVVNARFFLARALNYRRAGNVIAAQADLRQAEALSHRSTDLTAISRLYELRGTSRSKEGSIFRHSEQADAKYDEALTHLCQALYGFLVTENYEDIQSCCYNIGNTLHRLRELKYPEAKRWLKLSTTISAKMNMGRYEGRAEAILAKIAFHEGDSRNFNRLVTHAQQVCRKAGNVIDLSTCLIVRAFDSAKKKRGSRSNCASDRCQNTLFAITL